MDKNVVEEIENLKAMEEEMAEKGYNITMTMTVNIDGIVFDFDGRKFEVGVEEELLRHLIIFLGGGSITIDRPGTVKEYDMITWETIMDAYKKGEMMVESYEESN